MAHEPEFVDNLIEILNYLMKDGRETQSKILQRMKHTELFPFKYLHSKFVSPKRNYQTNVLIIDKLLPSYDNIKFQKIELQMIPTEEEIKTLPAVPTIWKISEGDKVYNSELITRINVWAMKDESRKEYEPSTKITEISVRHPTLSLGIYGPTGPIILRCTTLGTGETRDDTFGRPQGDILGCTRDDIPRDGHLKELVFDGWIRPIATVGVTVDEITIYTSNAKNEFWLDGEDLTIFATFVKESQAKRIVFQCFYLEEDREPFLKAVSEEVKVEFSY
jgi:hypothetical protein